MLVHCAAGMLNAKTPSYDVPLIAQMQLCRQVEANNVFFRTNRETVEQLMVQAPILLRG
jgi:hypothetical protein